MNNSIFNCLGWKYPTAVLPIIDRQTMKKHKLCTQSLYKSRKQIQKKQQYKWVSQTKQKTHY